ncbi:DMT family transporter [Rhodoferax sp.]|uniref:DMT family transporter n=1 Tax=Rhodoferax sp. TaxID=50421 RepID=UPI0025F15B42|nr:DMT family transporter [Rhodoferax sp.]
MSLGTQQMYPETLNIPPSIPPEGSQQTLWFQACGIFMCALLALATLDVLAKDLVRRNPAPLVNLFRYGVVLIMAMGLMQIKRCLWVLQRQHRRLVLWRSVMLGAVGLSFMQALHSMPLAEATAIYFLSPLIIVALSPWLLGEHFRLRQGMAVVAGFIGMLLIVRPGSQLPLTGTVLMLVAASSYAMLQILTRKLAGKVQMEQQFFWAAGVCTLMTLMSLPTAWPISWPSATDMALMVLVGILSGLGQYLLIQAFQKVPASSLAPFNYFHLLLAVMFSVVVFGQRPDNIALTGMAIIACSGLALTLPVFWTYFAALVARRNSSGLQGK